MVYSFTLTNSCFSLNNRARFGVYGTKHNYILGLVFQPLVKDPKQMSTLICEKKKKGSRLGCSERYSVFKVPAKLDHIRPFLTGSGLGTFRMCQFASKLSASHTNAYNITGLFSFCNTLSFFTPCDFCCCIYAGLLATSLLCKFDSLAWCRTWISLWASSGCSAHLMVVWSRPFWKQIKTSVFCFGFDGSGTIGWGG